MSLPRRVMWKASDGREFIIDTEKLNLHTQEQLLEHIAGLRKEHGYEEPTFMHLSGPQAHKLKSIDTSELPDDIRDKVNDVIKEGLNRPDPKTMN